MGNLALLLTTLTAMGLSWLAIAAATKGAAEVDDGKKKEATGKMTKVREELKLAGTMLGEALDWPDLGEMVDATAYTESRWNSRPRGIAPTPGSNKATGPMQMRPKSAGDSNKMRDIILADPTYIEDPQLSVAAAVAYWSRLSDNNPNATWADVRASFAFPVYIHGRPTKLIQGLADATKHKTLASQQQRYDDAVRRFKAGMRVAGLPESFMNQRAFPRVKKYSVTSLVPLIPSERGIELIGAMAK